MVNTVVNRLGHLRTRYVLLVFVAVGLIVFSTGLLGPFQNDDTPQIVDNPIVHSLGNIGQFFGGSTFYDGNGLSGVYYRPLMTTVYAMIYSVFGAQPAAFHIVQLGLHIATALFVFLVLTRYTKRPVAFILALVFLIHPMNSQVVFSIPTMQDALCAFFGMWALWRLMTRRESVRYWDVAGLLFLSLLAKEAGVLFVVFALVYQWLYRRKELRALVLTLIAPVALYVLMKVNAVGFMPSQHAGPINDLSFWQRLLTVPSVLLFYLTQFVWPTQLALTRYWTVESWSVGGVLVPLLIDIVFLGLLVWGWLVVRHRLKKPSQRAYMFFAIWFLVSIAPYLQLLPGLDMTACETWLYVPMIGLLGMIGVASGLITWRRIRPVSRTMIACVICIMLVMLGVRTSLRGLDYTSQYNLALSDLSVESDNYAALNNVAQYYLQVGDYDRAIHYARDSIDQFPVSTNYINLGVGLQQTQQYPEAFTAYTHALTYGNSSIIYQNLALLHIVASKPAVTSAFFRDALREYPHDFKLWLYDAVFEGALGNHATAQAAITTAAQYGEVPVSIYRSIMTNTPFSVPILDKSVLVR
jgi:hypothetical protein